MVKLSASRIKTYSNCSWLGYCKYNCRLPSKTNDGAKLGDATHVIAECLAAKKREDLVLAALESKSPLAVPSIGRLANKLLKERDLDTIENREKLNLFLLTALQNDFFGEGCIEYRTEYEFDFKTDKFHVGGFIDRLFIYEDKIRILDFKTSKEKFKSGSDDIKFNVQALIYTLVASEEFPDKEIEIDFLFCKFPKNPFIKMKFTKQQLEGFKSYLEYTSEYLSDFTVEKAMSDYAADAGFDRKWLCGKDNPYAFKNDGVTPVFVCEYRLPFLYFEASKDGEKTISAYKKKELDKYAKLGYNVVQKRYSGCPKWN